MSNRSYIAIYDFLRILIKHTTHHKFFSTFQKEIYSGEYFTTSSSRQFLKWKKSLDLVLYLKSFKYKSVNF